MSLQDELRTLVEDVVRKVVREELTQARQRPAEGTDPYLAVASAAELADVAPGTIRAWMKAGKLGRYRAGGRLRVRRSELLALLAGDCASSPGNQSLSPEALADRDHAKARRRGRRGRDPNPPGDDSDAAAE